jgi:hypothetical protein
MRLRGWLPASTGKIVREIAAKIFATSMIGAQWNWLCSRARRA